jgi:hydroxymethylglutaryl-CoA lyase
MNPQMTPSSTATLREVGLRDGLQSIPFILPTEHKLSWIAAAHAAGLRELEVGSYVVAFAKTLPGMVTSVLVPNLKGAERAFETQADAMLVPLSASHAHSLANLRKTPDEVIAEIKLIRAARDASGSKTKIEVGMSTAFGCTIQGKVETSEVLRLLQAVLDAGVDHVGLADTVGYADPRMVSELFEAAFKVAGDKLNCGHFHDTRGMGMANVYAAWQAGVTRFDACLAGIGGCPHAPGASGNVATEDVAFMLASMGVETGVNIKKLLALRQQLVNWLPDTPTHGTLWRAGVPKSFSPVSAAAAV